MAEKANDFMNKWGQALVQLLFLSILIPWGWKMTGAVNQLTADNQENKSWHLTHIQIYEKDRALLRNEITAELDKAFRLLVEKYEGKVDQLRQDLRATDMEVRGASASIKLLQDTITQMAARFSSLTADVRQALIDKDFERNAATKKGT
jgi:hypothetical protein